MVKVSYQRAGKFELDCLQVGPAQLYMILKKEISRILEEEHQQTLGSPGFKSELLCKEGCRQESEYLRNPQSMVTRVQKWTMETISEELSQFILKTLSRKENVPRLT